MDFWSLLLFIPSCFALNMAPGPNNLLALNNARGYGFGTALKGGIGRITAFMLMICCAATGLAAVLYTSETLFFTIKIIGSLYLLWIALKLWRSDVILNVQIHKQTHDFQFARQEFLLAVGNPKAILIFTAFLPQFVDTAINIQVQFLTLGAIFLMLEMLAIIVYALIGIYLQHWLTHPTLTKRFNKGCATLLGVSGINLLFSRS